MRTIIIIKNDVEFKWKITGSTEEFLLSLSQEELEDYFAFKYAQLYQELIQTTDAEVLIVNTDVEVLE